MLSPALSTFSIDCPNTSSCVNSSKESYFSTHLSTPNGSFFTTNQPAPYGTYVNGTCVLLSPASSPPSLSVVQPRVTSISALIDPKSSSRGVHQNKIQNHHRFGNYFTTTTPTSLLMNPAQNYRLIINSPTHSLPPENNRVSAIVHSKPQHFNHTDLPVAFKRSNGTDSYMRFDGTPPTSNLYAQKIRHIDDSTNSSSQDILIELQPVEIMDWLGTIALTRLTNLFELYSFSATAVSRRPKHIHFMQRLRNFVTHVKDKIYQNHTNDNGLALQPTNDHNLWGMSLSDTQAKTVDGSSLPRFVHDIINYLDRNACSVEGVFRKNGMKSRIQEIKECCSKLEPNQQIPNYLLMESQVHDIADVLKQYLRELPECLMTDQISEILENSVTELPESKHFAALHYCILVMPPENRQVLMILLKFLSKIANSSNINQMSAQNLATCLMPTLFRFGTQGNLDQNLARTQLKRRNTIGMPNERELGIFLAIKQILATMILEWETLLKLPSGILKELATTQFGPHLSFEIEMPARDEHFIFTDDVIQTFRRQHYALLKFYNDRLKGWSLRRVFPDGTQIYTRYVDDFCSLKVVRIEFNVAAPMNLIQASLLHRRSLWDMRVLSCHKVRSNSGHNYDVIKVTYKSSAIDPEKYSYLARRWSYGNGEPITIIERPVKTRNFHSADLNRRMKVLKSSFVIVPFAPDQSRVIYFSRIDLRFRGKNSLWYDRVYGEMLANQFGRFKSHLSNNLNLRGTLV